MAEQQQLIPAPQKASEPSADARAVYDLWVKLMGKRNPAFTGKRLTRVQRALKTYGLQDCLAAVRGCAIDEHHKGSKYKWADLPLIFRDPEHIERFRDQWRATQRREAPRPDDPQKMEQAKEVQREREADYRKRCANLTRQQFDQVTRWWTEEARRELLHDAAENGCEWAKERTDEPQR